ncbi:hypothetical protein [Paenibacillus sp. L3-i20]|uniref:hypothetical protein n=1 Tax=Paenibacillus sp. L3-i20 TaxID=2905833 RepID=UPI001EDDD1B6|nr:hypothetical protein [Paenibacillus sp. L3-i20]GKU77704.1 hypothetical protein L3i20_v221010 [Paenibacillus sp. L3-i20]
MNKLHNYMKLTMFSLFMSFVIAGCSSSDNKPVSSTTSQVPTFSSSASEAATPTPTVELIDSDQVIKTFSDLAMEKPLADVMYAAYSKNIVDLQPADADELTRVLESYYNENLDAFTDKLDSEIVQKALHVNYIPITDKQLDELTTIESDDVRQFIQKTLRNGYKLVSGEGTIYLAVDYSKLLIHSDKLTPAMKAYLEIMSSESNEKSMSDASIVIGLDELATRTLAAESFVVTYPDSLERKKIEQQYGLYLSMFLAGTSNTTHYGEKYMILPEVKSQYEQMVADYGETITGQVTQQLLDILKGTKGAFFEVDGLGESQSIPEVQKFFDNFYTDAVAKFPAATK